MRWSDHKVVHQHFDSKPDYYSNEILIKIEPSEKTDQFDVKIFQDRDKISVEDPLVLAQDFRNGLFFIHGLWNFDEAPKKIRSFFRNYYGQYEECVKLFDEIILSPTPHTQNCMDEMLDFFENADNELVKGLKEQILKAREASTPLNMKPLKEAIIQCRTAWLIKQSLRFPL